MLRDLYSNYYPRATFDLEWYQPHEEKFGLKAWLAGEKSSAFHWVPRNVRVLDIGCGFGASLGYHTARGCDVYGVEADENIRRVAEKFGYKVYVGPFDDSKYEAEFFDYVTMDQVIEHVTDPLSTLRGVARILKSGGTAILSTPNAGGWGAKFFGRHWINWHAPYHMQFFSRRSMQLSAEQAGLVVAEAKMITNSDWLRCQWIHLVSYPKLGEPSRFWLPNHDGMRMTFLQRRFIRAMHEMKINHLLTRVFDSVGLGDNYVFALKKQ
ncbi:MAG: class I SAM-dependent methyltransferase [Pyrinomonadaceae bacterium]|nr:class I SAM-dependent methyltransferase [Pyrinomonadaceae bacterium]